MKHIRLSVGVALVYQRFWWKGAYTAVHAMNALQRYVDADGKKIQNGYQLFMTYRLGAGGPPIFCLSRDYTSTLNFRDSAPR